MPDLTRLLVLATVTALGALLAAELRSRPRAALAFWLGVLAFVPFWLAVPVGTVTVPPSTMAALVVLPACWGAAGPGWGPSGGDRLLLVAVAATVGAVLLSSSPRYLLPAMLLQGVLSYVVGRRLTTLAGPSWSVDLVAVVTVACAVWAILETATDVHVFAGLRGLPSLTSWNQVQYRGGVSRAEGAWGHAIALGSWLSLGLPFVLGSSLRRTWWWVGVVLAGAFATLSRGPILGCLLVFALCVLFLGSVPTVRRIAFGLTALAVGAVVVPPVVAFMGTVSGELTTTQDYRAHLVEHALADVHLVGRADNVVTAPDGTLRYREFSSIDNAFLLSALDSGLVVTALLAAGLLVAVVRVLRGIGTVADIALAGQVLVLATVATITQYQAAVYFVAGVAVSLAASRQSPGSATAQPDRPGRVRA
ncbi:MAG: hypothetical protein J7518_16775 [Nocardioidaceae bacterium]|nr:hypothetical protein [Nocardioidaceae bacterium]